VYSHQFPEERLCPLGGFLEPKDMLAECKGMMQAAEREGEKFGLVIIDTLQAYFTGDDSNSNSQVVKFLRSLRPITELAHKPTVLVPAHPTKHAGDDALVPYGGGGILNEIDGNLTLSMTGDIVTLHYQDKLRGVPFEPIIYKSALEMADELVDQRGRLVELPVLRPAEEKELKAAEERELNASDKLLSALYSGKQPSARAAGVVAGLQMTAACKAVSELKQLKLIKGLPGGGVEITKAGREYLREHGLLTNGGNCAF
jgi:RecA-family ATPase